MGIVAGWGRGTWGQGNERWDGGGDGDGMGRDGLGWGGIEWDGNRDRMGQRDMGAR